jgi:hypothetical protein
MLLDHKVRNMTQKVLKEYASSTGGLIQVFAWGLRHSANRRYSGLVEVPEVTEDQPRRKRGRPKGSKNS